MGSLRVVADSTGNVVKRTDYDSFGNIISDTDPSFDMPFGFAGGLHDRDTGLVRFGYRDYDPDIGRWTAKDPILFAGGDTDLYGYVLNDPINRIDPEGKIWGYVAVGVGVAAVYYGYRIYNSLKDLNNDVEKYNEGMEKLINIGQGKSNADPCKTSDETVDAAKEIVKSAGEAVKEGGNMPGTFTGGRP